MNQVIKSFSSENTGGGCMVDLVELPDGRVVGISDECIALYPSLDAMYEGDENGAYNFPVISRPVDQAEYPKPARGTYVKSITEERELALVVLDNDEVIGIDSGSVCLYKNEAAVWDGAPDSVLGQISLS